MRQSERSLKQQVRELLDQLGAYYYMPVPIGYGKTALDFFVCLRGRFVAIETKRKGKKPTRLQELKIAEINRAGGFAFWADNIETVRDRLTDFYLARQSA